MPRENQKASLKEAEEPVFRVHITDPKFGTEKIIWLSESFLADLEAIKGRKREKASEEKTIPIQLDNQTINRSKS